MNGEKQEKSLRTLFLGLSSSIAATALLWGFGVLGPVMGIRIALIPEFMFAGIGLVAGSIIVLFLLLRKRKEQGVLRKHTRIVRDSFSIAKHPLPVCEIVSKFVDRSVSHLLVKRENVSRAEYVDLLDDSLIFLGRELDKGHDVEMYATSLLSPLEWLEDESGAGIVAYWEEQKALSEKKGLFKLTRVFILDQIDAVMLELKTNEIVREHLRKESFDVFACKKDVIGRVDPGYCIDMALFRTQKGNWVIDGGSPDSLTSDNRHSAMVVDGVLLGRFFGSMIKMLEKNAIRLK